MAEVQELILKYRADVSELQARITQIEAIVRKSGEAGKEAGKAIEDAFKKGASAADDQALSVDALKEKYSQLTAIVIAQASKFSSSGTEAGKVIASQIDLLKKLEVQLAKTNDPKDALKISQQIGQTSGNVTKLVKELEKVPPTLKTQVGLVENLKNRLTALTEARDKSNDPAKIERINKILAEQGGRLKALTGQTDEVTKSVNPLGAAFDALGSKILVAFSVTAIASFASASVKAFAESEKGQLQLLSALNGQEDVQQRLIQQADELQGKFGIDNDAIVMQQAFLAVQGRTEEQIKKTITAAIAYADVMDVDLATAVRELDKTFEGNIGRLAQKDEAFKKLSLTQLKNGEAIDLVNEKYLKFAEAGSKSVATQLAIQERRADDLSKTVGEKLAPAFVALKVAALDFISNTLDLFAPSIAKAKREQKDLNDLLAIYNADKGTPTTALVSEKEQAKVIAAQLEGRNKILEVQRKGSVFGNTISKEIEANNKEIARQELIQKAITQTIEERGKKQVEQNQKSGESLQALQKDLENLKSIQSELGDPLGLDKVQNDALLKQIEETERKINEITGKAGEERRKKAEENAKTLIELQKKIQESLKQGEVSTADNEFEKRREAAKKTFEDIVADIEKENSLAIAQGENKVAVTARTETQILQASEIFEKAKTQITEEESAKRTKKAAADEAKKATDIFKNNLDEINKVIATKAQGEENKVVTEFVTKGDFSDEAVAKNEAAIQKIREDANQQQIAESKATANSLKELGLEGTEFGIGLIAEIEDANKKSLDQQVKDGQDANKKKLEDDRKAADEKKVIREAEAEAAGKILSGIIELNNEASRQQTEILINNIQTKLDADLAAIDEAQAKAEGTFKKKTATEIKFEAQRKAIREKAAEEERKLKTQQAKKDKEAAIFQSLINTAVAVTKALPNFVLASIIAGLGLIETGFIIAQPIPQFAKGTKKAKGGLSMVGEKGTELMFVPNEAKILPNDKTKRYGDIIDAMYDSRLDNYILKNYIAPALKKQQQVSQSFAQNVTNSIDTVRLANDIAYALRGHKVELTEDNLETMGKVIAQNMPRLDPRKW